MKTIKYLKYLVLIVLPLNLLAQIKVIDSVNKKPVVGATISIDDVNVVKITDDFGLFQISSLNLTADKSITITSIGYQKKTISVKNLSESGSILLKPAVYGLKEVTINSRKYKKHLVGGGMSLLHGSNSYGGYSFEDARFFPNEYNENSKITEVQFYVIRKQSFQKKTSVDLSKAFGVGVYEANADGSPGKQLLDDALVITAKEHAEWVTVNLEQYNLPVTKYGFVVGFKIFPASFYGAKSGATKSEDFIAPVLAIKTYIKKSRDSWHRGLYKNSKWSRDTFSHFGIRAMVAEAK